MKIKEIYWMHRNDFSAILVCEHCGYEMDCKTGYNDEYYHNHVLPAMHCRRCGKNRAGQLQELDERYPDEPSSTHNDQLYSGHSAM